MLKQSIIATAAMSIVAISQPAFAGCSASGFCYDVTARTESKYHNTREVDVYYKEFDKKIEVHINCNAKEATSYGSFSMDFPISPRQLTKDVAAAIPSICGKQNNE